MPWPKGRKRSESDRQSMREGHAKNPWTDERRKKKSEQSLGFKHSDATKAILGAKLLAREKQPTQGLKRSPEDRANISKRLLGNQHSKGVKHSEEARERHAAVALHNFRGGKAADDFAAVLCPVGFVREHHVMWGPDCHDRFRLDFAHLEAMVAIEIDGVSHKTTAEYDAMRDELLRILGWRVIRIKV